MWLYWWYFHLIFTVYELCCLKWHGNKYRFLTISSLSGEQVAIHVGIASGTNSIILEQTGKNTGYKDRDVRGICPADNCCIQGGAERLDSIIDMRSISKRLKELGLDVIYSRDAGRFVLYCGVLTNCTIVMYSCHFLLKEHNTMTTEVQMCVSSVCRYLCDFVHYLSLHYGQRRAALIHVPACGSLASPGKLVPQLQTIIQVMLCQLDTQRIWPTASECRCSQDMKN